MKENLALKSTTTHWEVAVQQYSKALMAQVGVPLNSGDHRSNRTRLMTSVLLACFDSFIGDHKQAIVQIRTGLGLLEILRAERRKAMLTRPEEPVEDELLQMFTRLAIQAKSYDMAFHFPEPYVIHLVQAPANPASPGESGGTPVSIHQDPIPERFSSLIEARVAWDTLCEQLLRATESMAQLANGPPNLLPQTMMIYGRAFAARIRSWSNAFDHILASRTAPGITSQEKDGIAVLKMFQIMGEILFQMTFRHNEMDFDNYKPYFRTIVDLASEVVGDEERRAAERRCPNRSFCTHQHVNGNYGQSIDMLGGQEYTAHHIKPSFSADLGIVPPLYVVAAKSRDHIIRRQAIQLLRSSARREGMWDSQLTAQIGTWIMELEESLDEEAIHEDEVDINRSPHLPTPRSSPSEVPIASFSSPKQRPAGQGQRRSFDGDVPLGPGGNARWDARLESNSSAGSGLNSASSDRVAGMINKRVVPEDKRGDDDRVPARRMRQSKPKTKTGCKNCKLRRIKCDEKRPACTQCTRSKKICTGYPPPAHSARPFEEVLIAPKPNIACAGPIASRNANPPIIRDSVKLPPRRRQPQQRPTPPLSPLFSSAGPFVALYQTPAPGLTFDLQEGQYFQLFRSNTAGELSGYFDNIFWTQTVLRECHESPAVKHAVVALGALYKTLEKSTESPPGSPSSGGQAPGSPRGREAAQTHWEVAVQQYSKALMAQVGVPLNSGDHRSNRTRLMTSVLLACFDSFIGDHKQAIVQIRTGLGLLEILRAERRKAMLTRPEEPVEDELLQMFTRLAIQAKSYDMAFHFPEPYVIHLVQAPANPASPGESGGTPVSIHQDPIPERFSSLIEARVAWDTLCEQLLRATESMAQLANGPPNLLPQTMMIYGRAFAARIRSWSNAFDHILASRTAPGITSQEKDGIAVLKMFQIMGEILFQMTFRHNEMDFDNYKPYFRTIVDLASEVVGDEERRAAERRCPNRSFCTHQHVNGNYGQSIDMLGGQEYTAHHIKPSFSADLGIVPPLYVVAAKSRDHIIRRQAIQLLRSSARREGMWDSQLTAQIGTWIMELEESLDEEAIHEDEVDINRSPHLPTPRSSPSEVPIASFSSPKQRPAGQGQRRSFDGDVPLGPGGNARWDARLESNSSAGSGLNSASSDRVAGMINKRVVPEDKRVLLRSAEFDLREHVAVLRCGTRGLHPGAPDRRLRETRIVW
ncbi:hypothetical protein PpBr36_01599 [Pyricularia pennisetigena]|uniref:hypothetical protein n=1 Tax=Pyricularia pennisetigena TaxID=1578925 RepID=UPI001150592A|nr:hypothetical protein PpBr36_01599 [Pyricularia pennisetigena]TLS27880.1 hypothetical protein PpBr36_01599 [Pyricularia pennisetigena]